MYALGFRVTAHHLRTESLIPLSLDFYSFLFSFWSQDVGGPANTVLRGECLSRADPA